MYKNLLFTYLQLCIVSCLIFYSFYCILDREFLMTLINGNYDLLDFAEDIFVCCSSTAVAMGTMEMLFRSVKFDEYFKNRKFTVSLLFLIITFAISYALAIFANLVWGNSIEDIDINEDIVVECLLIMFISNLYCSRQFRKINVGLEDECQRLALKLKDINKSLEKNKDNAELSAELSMLRQTLQDMNVGCKDRFLVYKGDYFEALSVDEIMYISIKNRATIAYKTDGTEDKLGYSLDELEKMLNPKKFFRANRQYIISINAIKRVSYFYGGKVQVILNGGANEYILVSRDKLQMLKEWMNQ